MLGLRPHVWPPEPEEEASGFRSRTELGQDEAPSRQTWSLAPESNSKAGVRAGAGEGCCSGGVTTLFDFVGWERWERG